MLSYLDDNQRWNRINLTAMAGRYAERGALNDMSGNCLRTALLNNLDSHYGLDISTSDGALGSFNPCNYSIKFDPYVLITGELLTAELFHAYQEQFLGGKLNQIKLDEANDHKGGSNIEFEEAAMYLLAGKFTGFGELPGTTKLIAWIDQFLKDHPIHSNVALTQPEIDRWFEALEEFRTYYIDNPIQYPSLYDKPIDYDMLPTSLLKLWELSDCIN